MKTIFALLTGVVLISLVACGPSAEDIEKQRQDSIAAADSIARLEAEAAAAEQARLDSIAQAEAAMAADTLAADTTVAQ